LTTTPAPNEQPAESPVTELAWRWKLARCAALRTVLAEAGTPAPDGPTGRDADEVALVHLAAAADPAAALTRVFDNSRVLGLGFRRYYRIDLTLPDLADLLPAAGVPCHALGFHRDANEPAWRTARQPCTATPTSALCNHWRESIHGLIGGVSTGVYYSRLQSAGANDAGCADLLHVDAETRLRFSPIPADLELGLEPVRSLIHRVNPGAKLELLGLAEGALHYRLHSAKGACGTCATTPSPDADLLDLAGLSATTGGGLDVATVFAHAVKRRFPSLVLRDASARPVMDAS